MAQGVLVEILLSLFKIFCGGKQSQHQNQYPQQQQHQQQHQQQYNQYPGQQQQHTYPPHQQQQQYQQHQQNGQWQSHQNGAHPSKPSSPPGGIVGPHAGMNQDQINATNQQYTQWRDQARREGDLAHKAFAESQQAYQRGDGGRAHELSQQGKAHQAKQDQLDDQASAWIFNENNKQSPPGTVDLHGLYVKEAIERTEAAITNAQRSGQSELRVIVGKGIHSQGHVAKIKPAVQDLMQKYNLSAHIDPHNAGVLVVDMNGSETNGRSRDAGGLVDQMERGQDGCVIM